MNRVLEINRLTKSYGEAVALNNISFSLEEGKIYGLLGRNGAGKTTLMHIITAQLFATSGEVKVFGENPYENDRVLSQVCFIKESQKYPEFYRIKDVLVISKDIFPNWHADYALQLVHDFNLPINRKIKKLSRGMLSAVGIFIGLASRAPLTFFDEPYLGLDAVARTIFYDRLLEDYAEHPRTVVLSTHLIDEVSKLLEHVIVIDNGKMLVNEDAETLRGQAITITGPAAKVEEFSRGKKIIQREGFGGLVSVTVLGNLSLPEQKQAQVTGLELAPVSLQQLIVRLTTDNNERKAA